jgi:hypothetical protein
VTVKSGTILQPHFYKGVVMKTEDDFDKKYTMDSTVKSEYMCPESQVGMLETFGEDYQTVKRVYEQNPLRVWTMVDCDSGMYLIQGLHHVNRVYYMVTAEPAEDEFEEYLFDSYEDEVYYE